MRRARMASKRSHRGRRVGPPRRFYFPWEEKDRRGRRERELAREAKRWDEERIRRFEEDQRRKREYISFVEIADWCSELDGSAVPNEAARENAYRMLERDLLAGNFEEGGRSRVRFVFPGVSWTHGKMTRKWLQDAIDNDWDGRRGRSYLEKCWLPRKLFQRWCGWHHLPKSPPRFEPQENHDVDTQRSNMGGRPPAVDWEALKDALREEIKIHGYPDPRNPPGWRGTKDAVEFALQRLGKEGRDVSHRTIEDNVRRILRELSDASAVKPVLR
jgi:hypothetical protein